MVTSLFSCWASVIFLLDESGLVHTTETWEYCLVASRHNCCCPPTRQNGCVFKLADMSLFGSFVAIRQEKYGVCIPTMRVGTQIFNTTTSLREDIRLRRRSIRLGNCTMASGSPPRLYRAHKFLHTRDDGWGIPRVLVQLGCFIVSAQRPAAWASILAMLSPTGRASPCFCHR